MKSGHYCLGALALVPVMNSSSLNGSGIVVLFLWLLHRAPMQDRGKGRLVFLNRQIGKSVNRGKRGTKLYNYDICTFWHADYISIQRWKKKNKPVSQ